MSAIQARIQALEWESGCRQRGMTQKQIKRLQGLRNYRGWMDSVMHSEFCVLREMSRKKINQVLEDEVIMIPREPKSRGK